MICQILAIIEHFDHNDFLNRDIEKLVNKVLVILVLNKEHTYKYAGSPKGALGFFQFIPTIYKNVRENYKEVQIKT